MYDFVVFEDCLGSINLMKFLYSFLVLMIISGCNTTNKEIQTAGSPKAKHTVKTEYNPRLSPLVATYLEKSNRGLPRRRGYLTVQSVDLVESDLIVTFLYNSFNEAFADISNERGSAWIEKRNICRNPMYLEILKEGVFFYSKTVTRNPNDKVRSLSPISGDYCARVR